MSQAPAMPVFTDALLGDTLHLSAEEFGAYCLLLFATWRNNGVPLPDDDAKLARICRVTKERWLKRLRPTLVSFFDISGGNWRQKRLEKEWQYVESLRRKNAEAGKASASARALKRQETEPTTVASTFQPNGNPHTHTHIETDSSVEESVSDEARANGKSRSRGTRLAQDWRLSAADTEFALGVGLDPERTADAFADYWHAQPGQRGTKCDWSATWRNWCRKEADRRPRNGGPGDSRIAAALGKVRFAGDD